jgi:4-amino-4-deoxy-L-arabinose transferase-like glycosyltransferase
MSERRIVLVLILVTAALRIAMAANGWYGTDEAYMVGHARQFALGYLDHPPLHIWLVGAWAKLWGSDAPVLLRLPFITLFAGSTWLMYRLGERLFGAQAGLLAAVFFNLAPVFTLAHASWVLPDGPLIFFMLATVNVIARIVFDRPLVHPNRAWLLAGFLGGLACLSKFHGVDVFVAVLLFLLTVPGERRRLLTPGPWLGVIVAAIVFSPALIWNLQHAFGGVGFQAGRLFGSPQLTLKHLPKSIGGQMLYLTPWLMVPLGFYLGRALWRGPASPKTWLLALLAIFPIGFFTGAALFSSALPHWPMPGWLFTFPLMGEAWVDVARRRPAFVRNGLIASAAALIGIVGILEAQVATGVLGRMFPALSMSGDPTADLVSWQPFAVELSARRLIDDATPAVVAVQWIEAGKLNAAIGRDVPVVCLCGDARQFAVTQNLAALIGKNLLIVETAKRLGAEATPPELAGRFARIEPLEPFDLRRFGEPVIELKLFRGVGFKG